MPSGMPAATIAIRRTHAGSHASVAHKAIMVRIRDEAGSRVPCVSDSSWDESWREVRAQVYAVPGSATSREGNAATIRAQQTEGSHVSSLLDDANHCVKPAQHTASSSPVTMAAGTPPQHAAASATAMAVTISCSTISFTGPSLLHPRP